MKYRIQFIILTVLSVFISFSFIAHAVVAYPYPITVTQPDGTAITITLHGDEFLHWTTCNGEVVSKGSDGFYHPDIISPEKIEDARIARQDFMQQIMESRRTTKATSSISIGTHRFLVLLIAFKDHDFIVPDVHSAFNRQLNQKNYKDNDATGSVWDYFNDQSLGKFDPVFDVVGPVVVPDSMKKYTASYGQTQAGAPALLVKACQMVDSIVDFSQYDSDGDGVIDNVFFYYAGYNAAEGASGTIWPHAWAVSARHYFDGKRLYRYSCTSECRGTEGGNMAGIGTFSHEFGHTIGLPDFYDTNGSTGGSSNGVWIYSLMCYGNYNNDGKTPPSFSCEERRILGWLDGSIPWLPQCDTTMEIAPISTGIGYRSPTDVNNEYHYYEYRPSVKWDSVIAPKKDTVSLPGLLIYHVDRSQNKVGYYTAAQRWEKGQGINDNVSHECFKLILAESEEIRFPFGNGNTQFNANTEPSSLSWSGKPSLYGLYDISYDGQKASFRLKYNSRRELFGTVLSSTTGEAITNAVITVSNTTSNDNVMSTATDAFGKYSACLESMDTTVNVTISAPGCDSLTFTKTVISGALQHNVSLNGNPQALDKTKYESAYCICHDGYIELFAPDADSDEHMTVYAIDGKMIANVPILDGQASFECCNLSGLLLVRYGSRTFKIMVH